MSNLSPYLHPPLIWRCKAVGHPELSALINAITEGAIILDKIKGEIYHTNSLILELTSFTYKEIVGNKIELLFSDLPTEGLKHGNKVNVLLNRRKRKSIPVIVTIHALEPSDQFELLIVIPVERAGLELPHIWDSRVRDFIELVNLPDALNLNETMEKIVTIGKSILDTNLLCIYQAIGDFPKLQKLTHNPETEFFPEVLPSTDLSRLQDTTLWIPGKRVLTEIQKYARANDLSFLCTTPLGTKGAASGLIVVGDLERQPNKYFNYLIQIYGTMVSNRFSHSILVDHYLHEIAVRQQVIQTRTEVLQKMREGVFVLTPDLDIVEMNPAAEKMFEYLLREVHGEKIEKILVGMELLASINEAVGKGQAEINIQNISLHQRSGQIFLANIQINLVKENDKLTSILVIISDESENEKIRQRTRQLEDRAVLGEFASVFAHDVRNSINNIYTASQLLATLNGNEDPARGVINRIQSDCNRLTQLMSSILSFSRAMDSTKFIPIDMGEFLKYLLEKNKLRLNKANIISYFQSIGTIPNIKGDKQYLERVFDNLIGNAIDAMKVNSGGTLAIRVSLDTMIISNPQVEVSIADNGPGIPEEIKNRIFEPLVTTKSDGIGMGLAIAKKILTDHRGSISVNSIPGATVFHVYLPVMDGA
jgi:PAS domain S-box-containing protein